MPADRKKLHDRLNQRLDYIKSIFDTMHGRVDRGLLDGTEPGREWLEQFCHEGVGVQLCSGDFQLGTSIGIDSDQRKVGIDYWGFVDFLPSDGQIDYIVTNYLECFPNTIQILEEWVRALRPGGIFAVVCRDTDSFEEPIGPLSNRRRAHCFTLKTMTAYLTRVGLQVKQHERISNELRVMAVKL